MNYPCEMQIQSNEYKNPGSMVNELLRSNATQKMFKKQRFLDN
jgi:hypothetical protein